MKHQRKWKLNFIIISFICISAYANVYFKITITEKDTPNT